MESGRPSFRYKRQVIWCYVLLLISTICTVHFWKASRSQSRSPDLFQWTGEIYHCVHGPLCTGTHNQFKYQIKKKSNTNCSYKSLQSRFACDMCTFFIDSIFYQRLLHSDIFTHVNQCDLMKKASMAMRYDNDAPTVTYTQAGVVPAAFFWENLFTINFCTIHGRKFYFLYS